MAPVTLILGGARSGKSACAETLACQSGRKKIYVATAEALDGEMRTRIALHQDRRGDGWQTMEAPLDIAGVIAAAKEGTVLLVDCLTLWLSNLMHHGLDFEDQVLRLVHSLRESRAEVILVSNEVGQGIVPDNAMARQFRDDAGLLHQRVAEIAERVVWVVAGIPTVIKGKPL